MVKRFSIRLFLVASLLMAMPMAEAKGTMSTIHKTTQTVINVAIAAAVIGGGIYVINLINNFSQKKVLKRLEEQEKKLLAQIKILEESHKTLEERMDNYRDESNIQHDLTRQQIVRSRELILQAFGKRHNIQAANSDVAHLQQQLKAVQQQIAAKRKESDEAAAARKNAKKQQSSHTQASKSSPSFWSKICFWKNW